MSNARRDRRVVWFATRIMTICDGDAVASPLPQTVALEFEFRQTRLKVEFVEFIVVLRALFCRSSG
jgi:hypothetical protein